MRQRLGEECADVLLYLLLIAERAGVDLQEPPPPARSTGTRSGIPVAKARGTAAKYTELEGADR